MLPTRQDRLPETCILAVEAFGKLYADYWGRVVIDTCDSDYAHLHGPALGHPSTCRKYFDKLLAPLMDKRGSFKITVTFTEEP